MDSWGNIKTTPVGVVFGFFVYCLGVDAALLADPTDPGCLGFYVN